MIFLLFTLLYLIICFKINLLILLKEPSIEKALLTLHVTTGTHFYFGKSKKDHARSCQNVCDALTFLLDIFIQFGIKLYRQVVRIPIGTNCSPLVADLLPFCYKRDFMKSLSDDKQADSIEAFNTTY